MRLICRSLSLLQKTQRLFRWISDSHLNLVLRQTQETKTCTRILLKDQKWSGWEMKQRYSDLLRVQVGERKTVDKYMLYEEAERSDSVVPPHMNPWLRKKSFLPVPLKQGVSTITMDNSTNKTKYSQWDWCLTTLPVLYIKFWNSCTISTPLPWAFCHFLKVCIIRQFSGSGRWEESMWICIPLTPS